MNKFILIIFLYLISCNLYAQQSSLTFSSQSKSTHQAHQREDLKKNLDFQNQNQDETKDPLRVTGRVIPYQISPGQSAEVELTLDLPPGFHAYEDQFYFEVTSPPQFINGSIKLKPIKEWKDKFSNKIRRGVEKGARLTVPIEAPLENSQNYSKIKIQLQYQACSEAFCLFPITKEIELPFRYESNSNSSSIKQGSILPEEILNSFRDTSKLSQLLESHFLFGLIFVFFAGILTSLTPCIFPMIPITLAILGHHSATRRRSQNFLYSLVYVLGLSTTYSILGMIAASTGSLFGASLGNPIILSSVCVIFLLMALSMFGAFEVQWPVALNRFFSNKKSEGLPGAYVMGLIAGIVASPCVGPVLVSILTLAAATHNQLHGFILLFCYAFGVGTIFIILGLSYNLTKKLPRSGPWMDGIKFFIGCLMLVTFYYYLSLLIPIRWFDGFLGLGLILLGSAHFRTQIHIDSKVQRLSNGFMLCLMMVGSIHIAGAYWNIRHLNSSHDQNYLDSSPKTNELKWSPYSEEIINQAISHKKYVLIDFWANWCQACHELEEKTFSNSSVQQELKEFVIIKFDATHNSDLLKKLKSKYKIQGLPSLIFLNTKGDWLQKETLIQYESPEDFIQRIHRVRSQ